MKIIQIEGFKGLVSAVFIGACLIAGFVISPGYAAMTLWNKYLVSSYMFPQLNLLQGILLWAIVVITYCILTKGGFAVSLKNTPELSDEELDSIIKTAKISTQMKMLNRNISKTDRFENLGKNNPYSEDLNSVNNSESENEKNITNLK